MPVLTNVNCLSLPYKTPQAELKGLAERMFRNSFTDLDRLLESFENSGIVSRNLCIPLGYFDSGKSFSQRNSDYVSLARQFTAKAVNAVIEDSSISASDITDFIFISTTGISTPSIDALVINDLRLGNRIRRTPLWGLGCAGGVAGVSLACRIAEGDPNAVVLVASTELCSLTFLENDKSKSNLIATSLFSDGAAAAMVCGDEFAHKVKGRMLLRHIDSQSKLYYDSTNVMGWEMVEEGLKVIFSRDIPLVVSKNVSDDMKDFAAANGLSLQSVANFIIHPGGVKVIDAYAGSLELRNDKFTNTRNVLKNFGNMSSATVLYVLEEFARKGFGEGASLMSSLGPGFSSEFALFENSL